MKQADFLMKTEKWEAVEGIEHYDAGKMSLVA